MPELPEVHNVKTSLQKVVGTQIVSCEIYNNKLIKRPDGHSGFNKNIIGLTILEINRRGKYLLFTMSNEYTLIVHLGMTGLFINVESLEKIPEKYKKHLHIKMYLNNNTYLCYCDIRKFGSLRLLDKTQFENFKSITDMGPEVFDLDFKAQFIKNLSYKNLQNKTIKEALMDQSVVAGIGNIYASEILFASKIDPNKLVKELSDLDNNTIIKFSKEILSKSIELGGTSVSDYLNGDGKPGQYQNYLKVYGKKYCQCGTEITNTNIKGRSTFYCTKCQCK